MTSPEVEPIPSMRSVLDEVLADPAVSVSQRDTRLFGTGDSSTYELLYLQGWDGLIDDHWDGRLVLTHDVREHSTLWRTRETSETYTLSYSYAVDWEARTRTGLFSYELNPDEPLDPDSHTAALLQAHLDSRKPSEEQ